MIRILFAACLAILPLLAAAAAAQDKASAPPVDTRTYRYVYYPGQQIYYSTEQQIWFWRNGSGWSYGVHLPEKFRRSIGGGLPLELSTTRPFFEHEWVEERYGRPWRERHGDGSDGLQPDARDLDESRLVSRAGKG